VSQDYSAKIGGWINGLKDSNPGKVECQQMHGMKKLQPHPFCRDIPREAWAEEK
jgi:hypothetical protein